jgi:hypothetical protein
MLYSKGERFACVRERRFEKRTWFIESPNLSETNKQLMDNRMGIFLRKGRIRTTFNECSHHLEPLNKTPWIDCSCGWYHEWFGVSELGSIQISVEVWFSTVLLGGCFIFKIKHLIIIFWKFGKSKNLHSKCF